MKTKTKAKRKDRTNEVFGEAMTGLAETAAFLEGAGKKRFRIHVPKKVDVKGIRKRLKMSQDVFAAHFGFSSARVRDWEQGRSSPDMAARAYLRVIEEKPEEVQEVLAHAS